jgi:hypothetical protein
MFYFLFQLIQISHSINLDCYQREILMTRKTQYRMYDDPDKRPGLVKVYRMMFNVYISTTAKFPVSGKGLCCGIRCYTGSA